MKALQIVGAIGLLCLLGGCLDGATDPIPTPTPTPTPLPSAPPLSYEGYDAIWTDLDGEIRTSSDTTELPTTGSADYVGAAKWTLKGVYGTWDMTLRSRFDAKVDFSSGALNGNFRNFVEYFENPISGQRYQEQYLGTVALTGTVGASGGTAEVDGIFSEGGSIYDEPWRYSTSGQVDVGLSDGGEQAQYLSGASTGLRYGGRDGSGYGVISGPAEVEFNGEREIAPVD